jgi:hypothetical protein
MSMMASQELPTKPSQSDAIKRRYPSSLRKIGRVAQSLYLQRIKGYDVPDMPHFDSESTPYFIQKLSAATLYLEYGAGGSSILASKMGKNFVSVDSDSYFIASVKAKITRLEPTPSSGHGLFIHANLGLTEAWGVPVWTRPTKKRLTAWRSYFTAPWVDNAERFHPDLILVDGRFRVACALTSILHVTGNSDWELLVDDYEGRPHYTIIEQYANLEKMVGRMAVFTPKKDVDLDALQRSLDAYASDWR